MTTPVNSPYGFRPVTARGEAWCGKTRAVVFADTDGTAAFIGDMVKFTGESIVVDGKALSVVTVASPADTRLAGAVVRFSNDPDGYKPYRTASTQRVAYIPQDRDVLYSVQEDEDTTPLTLGAAEANIDFVAGAGGSTVTGLSSMQLDSDSVNTTDALPLRIVELEAIEGNDIGTGNYPQWLVAINQDAYSDKTGA